MSARARDAWDRLRAGQRAGTLAAVAALLASTLVYVRTLLPGVSFGDWADAALNPARLGIMHPTGYPLYILLGKLFSLIPVQSVAYRANLLSAVAAAAVVGMLVVIAVRLGVRPVVAFGAALCLAVTGTLWQEATVAEMNGLHLLLVALLLHRALVWRAERRDRDLVLGALLGGLCVSNHGLAITVVPLVFLFVLVDARRDIARHPLLLAKAGIAFALGLLPYAYLPLRALAGPPETYGRFLTWNGFFDHVSGAQFRGDMHFLSIESAATALGALPKAIEHLLAVSNVVFVVLAVVGVGILLVRDRWFGLLLVALGIVNVYFYANYLGDLSHYLLTTWLILGIGLAVASEAVVDLVAGRSRAGAAWMQYAVLLLALVLLASNWTEHDQSANDDGQQFTAEVFAALPQDAVLLTYWDAVTPLSYAHCIEGVRPDVTLETYDAAALVTCDPLAWPLTEVVKHRPVFALMVHDESLAEVTGLTPVPVKVIRLPWGGRYPQYDRTLYQLVPADVSP
jgi:hypothetical protein